jgi:hypothetical protein
MGNPKSVRSFRLDANVIQMLKAGARRRRISDTAFAEGILEQRLKAEPFIEAFDSAVLGKSTLGSILSATDSSSLEIAGFEQGKRNFALARELFESNGVDLSLPSYVDDILGKQARWFGVEGIHARPERISLYHRYGLSWSGFLKSYLSGAFEVISRNRLEASIANDFVSIRFPKPDSAL